MTPASLYVVRRGLPGLLAIMPHPAAPPGLDAELRALRGSGVDLLVSLIEAHERDALGLGGLTKACAAHALEHISHPVTDMAAPADGAAFTGLAQSLKTRLLAGDGIAVHCRAGIGRSGLLAASVLVALGASAADAFAEVSRARGVRVPEMPAQARWLARHERALRGE